MKFVTSKTMSPSENNECVNIVKSRDVRGTGGVVWEMSAEGTECGVCGSKKIKRDLSKLYQYPPILKNEDDADLVDCLICQHCQSLLAMQRGIGYLRTVTVYENKKKPHRWWSWLKAWFSNKFKKEEEIIYWEVFGEAIETERS